MKKTRARTKPVGKFPRRSADVLVTQAMLFGVRDELKDHIVSKIDGLHSEFHGLKSDIHEVKSEIHGLKSDIHEVKSEIHRLGILVEEQNARDRVVMDGLTVLFGRQDRVEDKVRDIETTLLVAK